MSARRGHGRRRRGAASVHEDEERWLLTYSDMITLLMALFMVLFSITSVNKSKLQVLTRTLQDAFSGQILPGGRSIMDNGGGNNVHQPTPQPPLPAIQPFVANQSTPNGQTDRGAATAAAAAASAAVNAPAAAAEQEDFQALKHQLDQYVQAHGLQTQVQTIITQRGLVIRLLTDRVLFDSGEAALKPQASPLLQQVAQLLMVDRRAHTTMVEGFTDNVPITGSLYPTNWELSTARAASVVRFLTDSGVPAERFVAAGYASLHPIATNATAAGRSRNRRVEVVLLRSAEAQAGGAATP